MDSITLSSLSETSRHIYEGDVTASSAGKRFILPFTFSDMSGVLRLGSYPGLTYKMREEIAERTTDLVLESIVGAF